MNKAGSVRHSLALCIFLSCLALAAFLPPGSGAGCRAAEAYGAGTQDMSFPQVIPSEQFTALAAEKLEERLSSNGEVRRHELKLVRAPQAMRLPAGEVSCETVLPKMLTYGANTPVNMMVYVDGKFFRKAVCYYQVKVYEQVLLVTHDMRLEQPITEADVRLEEREVETASVEYFHSFAEVQGKVPSRVLKAGQVLRKGMVQMPVAIEVGAPVSLVARVNGIEVKAEGIAQQKGRIGKYIRVRNLRSHKVMRGKVIDAHTVQVDG